MEERTFTCASCKQKLGVFEVYHLPGLDIYDSVSGMRYNSGNNYCKKCSGEHSGKSLHEEKLASKDFLQIGILKKDQTDVNLLVTVVGKEESQVKKSEKPLRLGKFKIKDDSGETELILWEEIVDKVDVGDQLKIEHGYIRTFMDKIQVTLGKNGVLTNLSK